MVSVIDVQEAAAEMRDGLRAGIKQTQKNVDAAITVLREYIENETQRGASLAKNINAYNAVFEKIANSAERVLQNSELLQKKLAASCAAINAIENYEETFTDVRGNFPALFDGRSVEVWQQLQRILDRLTGISHTCAHIQTVPKPYKEMISLYSVKLEQMFGALQTLPAVKENINVLELQNKLLGSEKIIGNLKTENDRLKAEKQTEQKIETKNEPDVQEKTQETGVKKNVSEKEKAGTKQNAAAQNKTAAAPEISENHKDYAAWKAHYRTGIGCASIAPERAILALTKAIALNPHNSKQFYFRGLAYKKMNNTGAALKDFEKAHQLSPATDEYINAINEAGRTQQK